MNLLNGITKTINNLKIKKQNGKNNRFRRKHFKQLV
jgi:hypothetical protein